MTQKPRKNGNIRNASKDKVDLTEQTIVITEKVLIGSKSSTYEPYLIQISGRETGQMYNLSNRQITLGRDETCSIILDDPHVSRVHAEINCTPNGDLSIKDLGSTNGIFLNGRKITEHGLLDGDKILIGTRLYFKFCYQDAVEQKYQQNLFRAANMDSLTQLYNKKYFIDVLSKELSFSLRNRQPLSLMMIDIDHFKKINDTYGHMAGDYCLKTVGKYLHKHLRLENVACRYGGEEFAVILRNVKGDLAIHIGERLRKAIEQEPFNYQENRFSLTISIGVATLEDNNYLTIEDLIKAADENLYTAKDEGRNRTVMRKAA